MKPMQRRHLNAFADPVSAGCGNARAAGLDRLARWLLQGLVICAALAMSGCALVPATPDPAVATQQMKARPERMIVLAVANPPETLMLRAGTTAGGYGAAGGYSPGGSARAQVAALARQYGLHEVSAWPIPSLKVHCAMLEIADGARRDEVLARLAADPRVRLAQPLQTFNLLGEPHSSGYTDLQQGFREIGADAAQKVTRGDSVRVAVIDTGVDTTHPDLHGRIAGTRNFVDEDWQQFNRDQHGTAVAGVIAADRAGGPDGSAGIEGVAPHAKVIAVKACWQADNRSGPSRCNSFTLAEAIQSALEAHAQIINLSLGGPADPLLSQLIELSVKKGVIVVGAVLPDGDLKAFPVGVTGVIAVDSARAAASAPADAGSNVLYAPGRDILTLTPGGHYDFVSGSSFAAANVTGTIALLLGLQPNLDAHSIEVLLDQTSGPSRQHGRVINACRAITALHHPCVDTTFSPAAFVLSLFASLATPLFGGGRTGSPAGHAGRYPGRMLLSGNFTSQVSGLPSDVRFDAATGDGSSLPAEFSSGATSCVHSAQPAPLQPISPILTRPGVPVAMRAGHGRSRASPVRRAQSCRS